MAFVWTEVSAGKVAVTTHVNEVKTNVDTLADNLGVSQYSWSEMPVAQDEKIDQPQIQELQDATDYIDSVNICSAENAGYDVTVDSSDDSTINATADSSIDSTQNTGVDSTQDVGVDSGNNTGIDATQNNSILSDQNTGVDSNQHLTYNASLDFNAETAYLTSVRTGFDTGVYSYGG